MIESPSASSMSRATDPIWLCATPGDQRASQLARQLKLKAIVQNTELVIFGTSGVSIDVRATSTALESAGYVKYFENAYMSGNLVEPARLELVQGYFDVVSSIYGDLTRSGLNAACYEHLLNEAKRMTQVIESCLDFGCGPGTILESKVPAEVPVVAGWDFSPRMRSLARSHGLPVLREVDFLQGSRLFDVVLAAFVFHYGTVSASQLGHICQRLRIGGIFVANFHKDLGLDHFMSTLSRVPGLQVNLPNRSSAFGTVVVVSRVR